MRYLTEKTMTASDFTLKADGADEGHLVARFTTFDIEDSYGDILTKDALDPWEGTDLLMVWAHQKANPIGKGKIRVKGDHAVWEGAFWLQTQSGREAYEKVKAAGDLQEYSWGFYVTEAGPADGKSIDSDPFWFWGPLKITGVEPVEVSPVLKGANPETGTLELREAAPGERRIPRMLLKTNTSGGSEPGSNPITVEVSVDAEAFTNAITGLTLDFESEAALAAVSALIDRMKSLADIRAAEGRELSQANTERLRDHRERAAALIEEIDALLKTASPADVVAVGDRFRRLRLAQAIAGD